jgi:APA family basic amino acid/polyamine antiporter
VVSMTGNNMGASLAGSRMLFALAESGDVPRAFAKIHPRHRTPSNAIIFTALVTLAFALSGSFTVLAVISALGRLVIYLSVCAATLRLRQPAFRDRIRPHLRSAPRCTSAITASPAGAKMQRWR